MFRIDVTCSDELDVADRVALAEYVRRRIDEHVGSARNRSLARLQLAVRITCCWAGTNHGRVRMETDGIANDVDMRAAHALYINLWSRTSSPGVGLRRFSGHILTELRRGLFPSALSRSIGKPFSNLGAVLLVDDCISLILFAIDQATGFVPEEQSSQLRRCLGGGVATGLLALGAVIAIRRPDWDSLSLHDFASFALLFWLECLFVAWTLYRVGDGWFLGTRWGKWLVKYNGRGSLALCRHNLRTAIVAGVLIALFFIVILFFA